MDEYIPNRVIAMENVEEWEMKWKRMERNETKMERNGTKMERKRM